MSDSIPSNEPWDESENRPDAVDDEINAGLDIDSALASVSALSDVIAEREAEEAAEIARAEEEQREIEDSEKQQSAYYFARPRPYYMVRGQIASVLPAFTLMLTGAWLTFTLSTTETAPDLAFIMVIIAAGVGVCLVAFWLSSGRWSNGAGFLGLALLLVVGTLYVSASGTELGAEGWPLLISAAGAALILTTLLGKARVERAAGTGFLLVIAGIAGFLVTTEVISEEATNVITALIPGIAVFFIVILLLPLVLRRRE